MKRIKLVQSLLALLIALPLCACGAASDTSGYEQVASQDLTDVSVESFPSYETTNSSAASLPQVSQPAAPTGAAILGTTVQIRIYALIDDPADGSRLTLGEAQKLIEQNKGHYTACGQGTLAAASDGLRIITHDHWGDILQGADLVQFLDAWNRPLQTITGMEFVQSILYRDQGTLVLAAPAGINLIPATLGNSHQVLVGETMWVTRQKANGQPGLEVVQAVVESVQTFKGQPAWKLNLGGGSILVEGDSGGGIWHDGMLMGNVWARELANSPVWEQVFGQSEITATSFFYAAQFPAQALSAASAASGAAPSLANGGAE